MSEGLYLTAARIRCWAALDALNLVDLSTEVEKDYTAEPSMVPPFAAIFASRNGSEGCEI